MIIFLPVAEKGIISFDTELHKEYSFATSYPVMQIMLDAGISADTDVFNSLECGSFSIEVNVGSINQSPPINDKLDPRMDGLTKLNIITDEGRRSPEGHLILSPLFRRRAAVFYRKR